MSGQRRFHVVLRVTRAHLAGGETLDTATLVRLGAQIGVPATDTRRMLTGDEFVRDVNDDIEQARVLGATGVPFFVLDRAYAVSGAQPTDVFVAALRTAREHPSTFSH